MGYHAWKINDGARKVANAERKQTGRADKKAKGLIECKLLKNQWYFFIYV